MESALVRYVVVLALGMHGVGHALFMANAWGHWKAAQVGRAQFFADVLGAGQAVEGVAGLVMLVPLASFLAGAWGYLGGQAWWRWLTLAAAAASIGLVIIFAGGLNTSSAFFAVAFDAVVIISVLWHLRAAAAPGA